MYTPASDRIFLYTGNLTQEFHTCNYNFLNDIEKSRADNMLLEQNRQMFIKCRSSLKCFLSFITGIKIEEIIIYEGVNGKPYLNEKDVFFNVSHSVDCFVIAITHLGQIGIDIEQKNRKLDYSKIKGLLFSESELNLFDDLEQDSKQEAIINAWTRKESFFKALGSGMTSPLKEFEVDFMPGSEPSINKMGWGNDEKENWKMISLDIDKDYIGAISVQSRMGNPLLNKFTFENLKAMKLFN